MGSKRFAFIGAGAMTSAIVAGMHRQGAPLRDVLLIDPSSEARAAAQTRFPEIAASPSVSSSEAYLESCDVIVVAVKPQCAEAAIHPLRDHLQRRARGCLIVSVMAGITLAQLEGMLHATPNRCPPRLVRVMPNTCLLGGHGASGYVLGSGATADDQACVVAMFGGALGYCVSVANEGQLNAVTGLSGSGPAFVATFIEALADGGVQCGLPRHVANQLALHTVIGTAKMLADTPELTTLKIKEMVCSPAGTTIAGVMELENRGLRAAAANAVAAAARRAEALSKL